MISREEFETEINSLLYTTMDFMQDAVESAGLDYDLLDRIPLCGRFNENSSSRQNDRGNNREKAFVRNASR